MSFKEDQLEMYNSEKIGEIFTAPSNADDCNKQEYILRVFPDLRLHGITA